MFNNFKSSPRFRDRICSAKRSQITRLSIRRPSIISDHVSPSISRTRFTARGECVRTGERELHVLRTSLPVSVVSPSISSLVHQSGRESTRKGESPESKAAPARWSPLLLLSCATPALGMDERMCEMERRWRSRDARERGDREGKPEAMNPPASPLKEQGELYSRENSGMEWTLKHQLNRINDNCS